LNNFGLAVHKKNQGSVQKTNPKKYDDQAFIAKFKNFRNKRSLAPGRNQIKGKICQKIQCFNCRKYGYYKNHCLKLKKKKETHKASVVEEREPLEKVKQDKTYFFF
jgi:hypothetical protein